MCEIVHVWWRLELCKTDVITHSSQNVIWLELIKFTLMELSVLHQNKLQRMKTMQRSNANKSSLHIDPQMETCMSFGCYCVAGSVNHGRKVEETVQLCSQGGAQSVFILERQSSADYRPYPGPLESARRGLHGCVKCPMHCRAMGHCKKSSIFDIFWDQINGKHCSVQCHVCQPQEIYSLGCFNVYMYVYIFLDIRVQLSPLLHDVINEKEL